MFEDHIFEDLAPEFNFAKVIEVLIADVFIVQVLVKVLILKALIFEVVVV